MIHWRQLSTNQRLSAVKSVWQPGMSAQQIAAALPYAVTRNSIIGMIHRHAKACDGVHLRPVGNNGQAKVKTVKDVARRVRRRVKASSGVPILATEPHVAGVPLMRLAAGLCKWPVNDVPRGGTFLFCGTGTERGPYCQHHASRALQESSK